MRAALVDLNIETGADFRKAFKLYRPADLPITANALRTGDRMYLDGLPEPVFSVKVEPTGGRTITFRHGLWWQPKLWLRDDDLVMPALPVQVTAVKAAWSDPFQRHMLPTYTTEGGTVAVLALNSYETRELEKWSGTWPWDIYISTLTGGWQRMAEGSLTVIIGEARSEQAVGAGAGYVYNG